MSDFITPEALVRQFRADSCVDCIHTDCRARRDCADELEAAAVKWAARDAELVALLEKASPLPWDWDTEGWFIACSAGYQVIEMENEHDAKLIVAAVNRLARLVEENHD